MIKFPLMTEKAVRVVDTENKLVFVVERKATKQQIKESVEQRLKVKVLGVNTLYDQKGRKRAYVQLSPETPAIDVATRLGLV